MGPVQINVMLLGVNHFACDTLRLYFSECQKKKRNLFLKRTSRYRVPVCTVSYPIILGKVIISHLITGQMRHGHPSVELWIWFSQFTEIKKNIVINFPICPFKCPCSYKCPLYHSKNKKVKFHLPKVVFYLLQSAHFFSINCNKFTRNFQLTSYMWMQHFSGVYTNLVSGKYK